jgi:hypothetical protein
VSPADERLATLAAVFAPVDAHRVLRRIERGDEVALRVGELLSRPRGERLAALAAAAAVAAPGPEALGALVAPERLPVRRVVAAVFGRTAPVGEPAARAMAVALLRRVIVERLSPR